MSDALLSHLRAALAAGPDGALCVAFSGGPDSSAVLHALSQLPAARERGLRALHVDHDLQPQSGAWARHCVEACAAWGVSVDCVSVQVDRTRGVGLEAAARAARYGAFAVALTAGERLVLAHHREDQAETVLLKLLRGAGPDGLGGMRAWRPFAAGFIWRPVLGLPRATLGGHLAAYHIACIEDPSNTDTTLGRNLLRQEILPRLTAFWPQAVDSIIHSADLCRSAAAALEAAWYPKLAGLADARGESLDAAGWLDLPPALRQPLLDHWLHGLGLHAPTLAQRREVERQCGARAGASPCIRWAGTELRIWKGRLWAVPPQHVPATAWQHAWDGAEVALPDGGTLALDPSTARLPAPLIVRLRQGGERLKPRGDSCTREVRDLFQQAGVPPWQRAVWPFLHADGELVAVGDRWMSERGAEILAAAGVRLHWRPHRARRGA